MLVRRMREDDLARVAELSNEVFPASHEAANRYDEVSLREELVRSIARLFVVEAEGEIEGFFVGWLVADELQVLSIGVAGAARRRGVGSSFLRIVLEEAQAEGATTATFELRDDNAPALGLYRRLGFCEVGRRGRYYADGTAAVLMQYDYAASAPNLPR